MTRRGAANPLQPRKMPRQRRSAATVDDMIEAAARILERDGLAGYNTNAVATLAGVSIGSLYQYFPNKDSLTRGLILREARATLALIDRLLAAAGGLAAVDAIIDAAIERQLARPALARLIDLEESRLDLAEDLLPSRSYVEGLIEACLPDACGLQGGTAGMDVIAIIKGLVDGAGLRGETDRPGLRARVRRAVFGYLGQSLPPAPGTRPVTRG